MATVPIGNYPPSVIEGGTTVWFMVSTGGFDNTNWTMRFVMNNGVLAPVSIAGTASGNGFLVVIPSNQSGMPPGRYTWAEVYTAVSGGDVSIGVDGFLTVLPGILATATPTFAQTQVTLLEGALASLAASTRSSVNFNGQSFTRANLSEYQKQLVFWQARVIAEQERIEALRGNRIGGEVSVEFARPQGRPFALPGYWHGW